MKNMILALVLIAPLSSYAQGPASKVLNKLVVDLDGDGKPDVVTVYDTGNAEFLVLEVRLSKEQKTLRYERLVRRTHAQRADRNDNDGSMCRDVNENEFTVGTAGSFLWKEVTGEYDGCLQESRKEITFQYANGDLLVQREKASSKEWHAGDPAPFGSTDIDFGSKRIVVTAGEMHIVRAGETANASLPMDCQAPALKAYIEAGLPSCASKVEDQLLGKVNAIVDKKLTGSEQ